MRKSKKPKPAQDFSMPFSVLLFKNDAAALETLSAKTGVTKSVLIRLAVHNVLKSKGFQALMPAS